MNKYFSPKNYWRAINSLLLIPFSPLIRKSEKGKIEHYGNRPLKHQPVFIIGSPRTGSTILYQTLTNLYNLLYIDNLVCKFYKNFFFGFWLSNKLYGDKPHDNYLADCGNTSRYGLHAPSECGHFWYRWLPKDHHFIDHDEITDDMVEQIRKEVAAVINYFDKPLVFKNLNAGQRLRLIHKCFPDALYINIKRKPFFTVQSILLARKANKISKDEMWSIKPKNYTELLFLDEISMVTAQVFFLEKQIDKDLQYIDYKNKFSVQYELMTSDLDNFLVEVEKALNLSERQKDIAKPTIYCNNTIVVSEESRNLINRAIQQYEW